MRAIWGGAAEQHEGGAGKKEPHVLLTVGYGLVLCLGGWFKPSRPG